MDLLDAGRPPLRVLRYEPAVGASAVLRFSASAGSELVPDVALTLAVRVSSVSPAGDVRLAVRLLDASEALRDASGELELSARGTQHTFHWMGGFHYGHGGWTDISLFQEGLDQAVGDFGPVWPADPVGPGARWQTTRQTGRSWAGAGLTSTYTLVSLHDDRCELQVETSLAGERQWVSVPNQGSDVRYELLAMSGAGRAALTVPLAGVPLPFGETDLAWSDDTRTDRGSDARGFASSRSTSHHGLTTSLREAPPGRPPE